MMGHEELVRALCEAMYSERLCALPELVTEDCVDENPIFLQPPGRAGIELKLGLWRRLFPQSSSEILEIEEGDAGAVALWRTVSAPGQAESRWRGHFQVSGGRICAISVQHVG